MTSNSLHVDDYDLYFGNRDLKANHFYFGLNKHTLKGHNQTHPEIDTIQNHYPDIEELLKRSGPKICGGVDNDYILKAFDECKYVFVLTEIHRTKYELRKKHFIDDLCGLVFMKDYSPKETKTDTDYLYLSLICGKKGFGGQLLQFCEDFAKYLGRKRVKLDSLSEPLGFYLYKGYKLDNGESTYYLGDNDERNPNDSNFVNIETIPEPKLGYILSQVSGGKTFKWIVVKEDDQLKYKLIEPGFFITHKRIEGTPVKYKPIFKDSTLSEIKKHDNSGYLDSGYKDIKGGRISLSGGLITELKDVSSYRLDGDGVGMTKILDIDPSTLTQFKTRFSSALTGQYSEMGSGKKHFLRKKHFLKKSVSQKGQKGQKSQKKVKKSQKKSIRSKKSKKKKKSK